jgi:hypothetical protein
MVPVSEATFDTSNHELLSPIVPAREATLGRHNRILACKLLSKIEHRMLPPKKDRIEASSSANCKAELLPQTRAPHRSILECKLQSRAPHAAQPRAPHNAVNPKQASRSFALHGVVGSSHASATPAARSIPTRSLCCFSGTFSEGESVRLGRWLEIPQRITTTTHLPRGVDVRLRVLPITIHFAVTRSSLGGRSC